MRCLGKRKSPMLRASDVKFSLEEHGFDGSDEFLLPRCLDGIYGYRLPLAESPLQNLEDLQSGGRVRLC
jgi:hypothetical protein